MRCYFCARNALFSIANSTCFDFSCICSIVAKRFPFIGVFRLGKRKNSAGTKFGEYGVNHGFYGFVFGRKLPHKHRFVRWCVIMLQNPWLSFPQFSAFLTNCFVQLAYNSKKCYLTDRTTLWQEFLMYHAIAIEENSEQNLQIWLNLSMQRCFCLKFSNFGTIFSGARFMPKISLKIAWHGPNERANIALLTLNVALLKFLDCVLDFQIRIYLHTHLISVDPTIIMDMLWSVFVETF